MRHFFWLLAEEQSSHELWLRLLPIELHFCSKIASTATVGVTTAAAAAVVAAPRQVWFPSDAKIWFQILSMKIF